MQVQQQFVHDLLEITGVEAYNVFDNPTTNVLAITANNTTKRNNVSYSQSDMTHSCHTMSSVACKHTLGYFIFR